MDITLGMTSKQILDKVFKGCPRGYDPMEVDEFLDAIIKDYLNIESNVLVSKEEYLKMKNTINTLSNEKHSLEIELGKYKERFANIKTGDNVTNDNMELIKKINKYEKFLFNHGYNPYNIK